jgi:hypothetical protein
MIIGEGEAPATALVVTLTYPTPACSLSWSRAAAPTELSAYLAGEVGDPTWNVGRSVTQATLRLNPYSTEYYRHSAYHIKGLSIAR